MALAVFILTLTMIVTGTIQAPATQTEESISSSTNATLQSNSDSVPANESSSPEQPSLHAGEVEETVNQTQAPPVSSCPAYHTGNPAFRNRTGCLSGAILDPVDHELAFGFHKGSNPDWNNCNIPRLPQAK